MKLITKCTAAVLATVFAAGGTSFAYYEDEVAEIKSLIDACDAKNIPTDYETVGYKTLEKFSKYIDEDIKNGVNSSITDYNKSAMANIYNSTKTGLNALLSGEKKPVDIPTYDMNNLSIKNNTELTDGKNTVFSTGYGHFSAVKSDMENLHSFGMNNFQMETGPTNVICVPGWGKTSAGGIDCYYDVVKESDGNSVLQIENKSESAAGVYFQISKTVQLEANTMYTFGCGKVKGTNVSANALKMSLGTDEKTVDSITSDWSKKTWSLVTKNTAETLKFSITVQAPCDSIYLDDVFVKKGTTGDNLLSNGDFEAEYSQAHIDELRGYFDRAEKANVSVSFLLQPKYFWKLPGCSDMYYNKSAGYYNISDPRAKAKIEQYLRTLLPLIQDCKAISDICLTNEPTFDTRYFPDYYNPLFREYLLNLYGDLNTINTLYKTSYTDISEITMPNPDLATAPKTAIFYDWIEFNEDVHTEWHKWFAGIVREYFPNTPLHSKIMNYFTHDAYANRFQLLWGVNAEKFNDFCDYSGNDASSNVNFKETMITKMMWYDYLYSINKKPIYNSEDHFIADGDTEYADRQKNNVRYNLWQGAIRGRNLSTMWVWERSYDTNSAFYGSILTRPDCVAEAGYTSLDLMRLSEDVSKLQKIKPEVALLYSKTSALFNDAYPLSLMNYYKGLIFAGKRVGFVSEYSYDNLSDYKYLVIPNATYTTPEFLKAVEDFVKNGGKVIYYGNALKYDKFGNTQDTSKALTGAYNINTNDVNTIRTTLLDYFNDRVQIIDTVTGKTASGVEYEYVVSDDEILVNVCGQFENDFYTKKTLSVYLDGSPVTGLTDIVTGEKIDETFEIEGYIPRCFKLTKNQPNPGKPSRPYSLKVDTADGVHSISWKADNFENAEIYKVEKYGNTIKLATVYNLFYDTAQDGTYMIVPFNSIGERGDSNCVTVRSSSEPIFNIEWDDVKWRSGGVAASVAVQDLSGSYNRGIVKLIAKDKDDNVVGIAVNEILVKNDSEFKFKAVFSEEAETVEAVVMNTYFNDTMLSDYIVSYKE